MQGARRPPFLSLEKVRKRLLLSRFCSSRSLRREIDQGGEMRRNRCGIRFILKFHKLWHNKIRISNLLLTLTKLLLTYKAAVIFHLLWCCALKKRKKEKRIKCLFIPGAKYGIRINKQRSSLRKKRLKQEKLKTVLSSLTLQQLNHRKIGIDSV